MWFRSQGSGSEIAVHTVGTPALENRLDRSYLVPTKPPVPVRPPSRSLVLAGDTLSAAANAYSRLGARLLRRLEENGWSAVAITVPPGRTIATPTAINLAGSLARDFDRTVILMEFDVVNPSICARLGYEPREGLVDYLRRDVPLGRVVFEAAERLIVLPAGLPDPGAKMLLASPKMGRLVETLRARHENAILVFDVPSWLIGTNPVAFTRLADCILLVVGEDETRMADVHRAVQRLKPANIAGVVLNSATRTGDEDE